MTLIRLIPIIICPFGIYWTIDSIDFICWCCFVAIASYGLDFQLITNYETAPAFAVDSGHDKNHNHGHNHSDHEHGSHGGEHDHGDEHGHGLHFAWHNLQHPYYLLIWDVLHLNTRKRFFQNKKKIEEFKATQKHHGIESPHAIKDETLNGDEISDSEHCEKNQKTHKVRLSPLKKIRSMKQVQNFGSTLEKINNKKTKQASSDDHIYNNNNNNNYQKHGNNNHNVGLKQHKLTTAGTTNTQLPLNCDTTETTTYGLNNHDHHCGNNVKPNHNEKSRSSHRDVALVGNKHRHNPHNKHTYSNNNNHNHMMRQRIKHNDNDNCKCNIDSSRNVKVDEDENVNINVRAYRLSSVSSSSVVIRKSLSNNPSKMPTATSTSTCRVRHGSRAYSTDSDIDNTPNCNIDSMDAITPYSGENELMPLKKKVSVSTDHDIRTPITPITPITPHGRYYHNHYHNKVNYKNSCSNIVKSNGNASINNTYNNCMNQGMTGTNNFQISSNHKTAAAVTTTTAKQNKNNNDCHSYQRSDNENNHEISFTSSDESSVSSSSQYDAQDNLNGHEDKTKQVHCNANSNGKNGTNNNDDQSTMSTNLRSDMSQITLVDKSSVRVAEHKLEFLQHKVRKEENKSQNCTNISGNSGNSRNCENTSNDNDDDENNLERAVSNISVSAQAQRTFSQLIDPDEAYDTDNSEKSDSDGKQNQKQHHDHHQTQSIDHNLKQTPNTSSRVERNFITKNHGHSLKTPVTIDEEFSQHFEDDSKTHRNVLAGNRGNKYDNDNENDDGDDGDSGTNLLDIEAMSHEISNQKETFQVAKDTWFGEFTDLLFVAILVNFTHQVRTLTQNGYEYKIGVWLFMITDAFMFYFAFFTMWYELSVVLVRFHCNTQFSVLMKFCFLLGIATMTLQLEPDKHFSHNVYGFMLGVIICLISLSGLHWHFSEKIENCHEYCMERIKLYVGSGLFLLFSVLVIVGSGLDSDRSSNSDNNMGDIDTNYAHLSEICCITVVCFHILCFSSNSFRIMRYETITNTKKSRIIRAVEISEHIFDEIVERWGLLIMISIGELILTVIQSIYGRKWEYYICTLFCFIIIFMIRDMYVVSSNVTIEDHALYQNKMPGSVAWTLIHFSLSFCLVLCSMCDDLLFLMLFNNETKSKYFEHYAWLMSISIGFVIINMYLLRWCHNKFTINIKCLIARIFGLTFIFCIPLMTKNIVLSLGLVCLAMMIHFVFDHLFIEKWQYEIKYVIRSNYKAYIMQLHRQVQSRVSIGNLNLKGLLDD